MTQVITQTSWASRLKNACAGVLFGFLLILGSFYLIFWNEGSSLSTAQSLSQTQKLIIPVPESPIDAKNNLRVLHLSGFATTDQTIEDKDLHVSQNAIQLSRDVQMYQWKEAVEKNTEKQAGGSEKVTTNYTYRADWSSSLIDSDQFYEKNHANPKSMLLKSKEIYATHVTVGDFDLPKELIEKISNGNLIDLSKTDVSELKKRTTKSIQAIGNIIYIGNNPDAPEVGDLKITVKTVLPQTVSIIAQQINHTLQPYAAPAGKSIMLLVEGQKSAEQMIQDAQSANKMWTWILRGLSLIIMVAGIGLILKPLSVLADVIPLLGTLVELGIQFIAFIVGLVLWCIALAIAWFAARPLLSIAFIGIALFIMTIFIFKKRNLSKKRKIALQTQLLE